MARVCEKLGFQVLLRELDYRGIENTPQYDPYEDETQNEQILPQLAEELEPMSEVGNHNIEAEIFLPRGDEMARGHVVARSSNASGNSIRRAYTNNPRYQIVSGRDHWRGGQRINHQHHC